MIWLLVQLWRRVLRPILIGPRMKQLAAPISRCECGHAECFHYSGLRSCQKVWCDCTHYIARQPRPTSVPKLRVVK